MKAKLLLLITLTIMVAVLLVVSIYKSSGELTLLVGITSLGLGIMSERIQQ